MSDKFISNIEFEYSEEDKFAGFKFISNFEKKELEKALAVNGICDSDLQLNFNLSAILPEGGFWAGLYDNGYGYIEYRMPKGFVSKDGEIEPYTTMPRRFPFDFTTSEVKSIDGETLTFLGPVTESSEDLYAYKYNLWNAQVLNQEAVLLLKDTKFPHDKKKFSDVPTSFRNFLQAYAQNSANSECLNYNEEKYVGWREESNYTIPFSNIGIQAFLTISVFEPTTAISSQYEILPCNCCGELAARIESNTQKVDDNTAAIAQNKSAIHTNTRDIKENREHIRKNTKDIKTNAKGIARNKRAIDCLTCKPRCHRGHRTACSFGTGVVFVGALLLAGLLHRSHEKKCT